MVLSVPCTSTSPETPALLLCSDSTEEKTPPTQVPAGANRPINTARSSPDVDTKNTEL